MQVRWIFAGWGTLLGVKRHRLQVGVSEGGDYFGSIQFPSLVTPQLISVSLRWTGRCYNVTWVSLSIILPPSYHPLPILWQNENWRNVRRNKSEKNIPAWLPVWGRLQPVSRPSCKPRTWLRHPLLSLGLSVTQVEQRTSQAVASVMKMFSRRILINYIERWDKEHGIL